MRPTRPKRRGYQEWPLNSPFRNQHCAHQKRGQRSVQTITVRFQSHPFTRKQRWRNSTTTQQEPRLQLSMQEFKLTIQKNPVAVTNNPASSRNKSYSLFLWSKRHWDYNRVQDLMNSTKKAKEIIQRGSKEPSGIWGYNPSTKIQYYKAG